ncbi:MAG: hypothetical protein HGB23_03005 [Chlorobiaceae bacterium]|nr:hypothetical protein [Chlorobiaceae bacterium]
MHLANRTVITRTLIFLFAIASVALAGEAVAENSVTVQTKVTINISDSLIRYLNKIRKEADLKKNTQPSSALSNPSQADTTRVFTP